MLIELVGVSAIHRCIALTPTSSPLILARVLRQIEAKKSCTKSPQSQQVSSSSASGAESANAAVVVRSEDDSPSVSGTQFTCFTGTKVPILTLRAVSVSDCTWKDADSSEIHLYCHFTWFDGTKVQILTHRLACQTALSKTQTQIQKFIGLGENCRLRLSCMPTEIVRCCASVCVYI